jgi:hypothetical protein
MEEIAKKNNITWEMDNLGTSIAGNLVPYITIYKKKKE